MALVVLCAWPHGTDPPAQVPPAGCIPGVFTALVKHLGPLLPVSRSGVLLSLCGTLRLCRLDHLTRAPWLLWLPGGRSHRANDSLARHGLLCHGLRYSVHGHRSDTRSSLEHK